MLTTVAYVLAAALCLMVLFIGVRFLTQPIPAAAGYGVPARPDGDRAYLTIKGVRDFTFGVVGLTLLAFSTSGATALFMATVSLAPFGDTLVVLRNGGTKAAAFGIHFTTAVVVLVSAALLLAV
jgi:hypothetical protein